MRSARLLLGLAAAAVMFAAADTYVVVLALPDMMGSVGLSVEQLQRAAPIVSGFLLGYVAMLPLIGRIADLRGRTPVLVAALVVFAFGSLVTAAAYDLGSLVVGRFLQGVGGGGLVPVTLALVADLYPVERRGVPLGVVGAVQELGSVVGPLYGAVVISLSAAGATSSGSTSPSRSSSPRASRACVGRTLRDRSPSFLRDPMARSRGGRPGPSRRVRAVDWPSIVLLVLALTGMVLVMRQPPGLVTSVSLGGPFVPFSGGGSIWWSPIGVVTIALAVLLVARLLTARRPLVDLRDWWASAREADLVGALLLSVALAGVILAFATADPQVAGVLPCRSLVAGDGRGRCRPVRGAQPPGRGSAGAARRVRRGGRLGIARRQLLRGSGPDRCPGGHPDLRPADGRRRLAGPGRVGTARVPRRPAGRSPGRRRADPPRSGRRP